MSTHKNFDKVCVAVLIVTLLITVLFMNASAFGVDEAEHTMGYENTLFDPSRVHTINIVIDDWDGFLETATSEAYSVCSLVIDNEAVRNVGIRGKGNTSLSTVATMDSNRYSFKIEFDQYESGKSYHGLDKLCLNNLIQDNTYMKDYLAYRMMEEFGADAPLCSYVWLTVNGEDWGLYLAVEAIEDSFLQRVYGGSGDLYKPDSMSFGGGGPGNGKDFNMDDFMEEFGEDMGMPWNRRSKEDGVPFPAPGEGSSFSPPDMPGGMGMGSSDVKLQYTDDDPDSYSNIFNNAKTDVTYADETRLIRSLKSLAEKADPEEILDTDEIIRYFVVHNFTVNSDSYTGAMIHNYYLHESEGRLSMIPWDYNLAFGSFQGSADATDAVNDPIDDPLSASAADRPMWGWIVSNEEYLAEYHERFAEFLDSVDIVGMIDETDQMISPYVEKDPTAFCTAEEYEKGVDTLRSFCSLRIESIRGQLEGTIPATDEGQSADSSALVNASGITISDMGSMNRGGGFGDRERGEGREEGFPGGNGFPFPERDIENGFSFPGGESFSPPEMNSDGQGGPGMMQPPGNGSFSERPGGNSSINREAGLLLGACVIALLVGTVIAFRFKRYA